MASINEKLNYINETKSLIKDKLNNLGSEIDNETTFREYVEKIEDLYEEWPKINDEDTSISLNNSKKGKMNIQLKGNINQFTTTGRNKINEELLKQDADYNTYNTTTKLWTTNIGYNGDYNRSILYNVSGYGTNRNANKIIDVTPNTTYTLKFYDATLVSYNLGYYDNEGIYISSSNSKSTQLRTFTTPENCKKLDIRRENPQTQLIFSKIMIIEGEYTEETIPSYEPYTGGIASPNPNYPQDIEIVTGENTITISNEDNTQSQTFDIDLGNLELSKIGEYQDYIFKNNEKWYKYEKIQKIILDGTQTWNRDKELTNSWRFYTGQILPTSVAGISKSDKFINVSVSNLNTVDSQGICRIYDGQIGVRLNKTIAETIIEFKAWQVNNNINLYYVLSTPNTVEITDTTLITQLNALEQAMSYNNQTNISQTNDNLPFIISANALLKNSN